MRKTKIIGTIGPVSEAKEVFTALVKAGLNIARLNFSHAGYEEQLNRIIMIKEVRKELKIPIAILLDTKGPEIRIGQFKEGEANLVTGQTFTLVTEDILGDHTQCSVTYKQLPNDIQVNDTILIDDGLIELRVQNVEQNKIHCIVVNGGVLGNKKGMNIPNVKIKLPAITEKDKRDILFGIKHGIDFIAASFVRSAEAVREIKSLLKDNGAPDIQVIAKIENQEGIDNIDEIIRYTDGVMVARGDLGVEIPTEMVPIMQKTIIKKCNLAGKPVIIATHMLDSMIRNCRPTRAEVTDVANAIYDGTDAVMLSGETAVGINPAGVVTTMDKIAETTENSLDYTMLLKKRKYDRKMNIENSVSFSSCATAQGLEAKAIISATYSGTTARMVSKFRPQAPIIGVTPLEKIQRRMLLYWGVIPLLIKEVDDTDELLEIAVHKAKEMGYVNEGDLTVITAGVPAGSSGGTNLMKVHKI